MDIDQLTIGEAKEIASFLQKKPDYDTESPWEIGKIYLIRTVTMIDTGRLVAVTPSELVLEDAAWIADTGRFHDQLKKLDFNQIEPFPDGKVIIGRGAIIDAVQIDRVQRIQK